MHLIHIFRRLRFHRAWVYKGPLLMAGPYYVLALSATPALKAFVAVLASMLTIGGVAGLAYLINDLADRASDHAAGKPNSTEGASPLAIVLATLILLLAALLPWATVLPFSALAAILLGIELMLFILYAVPPFRWKERGFLGLATDAGYAYVVPALLAAMTFASIGDLPRGDIASLLMALVVWQGPLGLRNIILHQIDDSANDIASKTQTWVLKVGECRAVHLTRKFIIPLEIGGFLYFCASVYSVAPAVTLVYPIFLGLTILVIRASWRRPLPTSLQESLILYLSDYYDEWLPVLLLLTLVASDPGYLPLLLLHLVAFRKNAVRTTLREIGIVAARLRAAP